MKIVVPGKWILTGEHAVVRNAPAIVFPLLSRTLTLEERVGHQAIESPLQEALKKIELTFDNNLKLSHLHLSSDIPLCAGLGSSAALSVAVARYLKENQLIFDDEVLEKALEFENIFHGTSSGLDLAAVVANGPIFFRKGSLPAPLELAWTPKIFLHDTGTRSSTKECVEHVVMQNREDLDQLMMLSVETARMALRLSEADGISVLQDSILTAAKCFHEWQLMNPESIDLEQKLYAAGALAVKPTGSGNGGFLLSLWNNDPPEEFAQMPTFRK